MQSTGVKLPGFVNLVRPLSHRVQVLHCTALTLQHSQSSFISVMEGILLGWVQYLEEEGQIWPEDMLRVSKHRWVRRNPLFERHI